MSNEKILHIGPLPGTEDVKVITDPAELPEALRRHAETPVCFIRVPALPPEKAAEVRALLDTLRAQGLPVPAPAPEEETLMDPKIKELCEEVERLDQEATPQPWQARFIFRVISTIRRYARRFGLMLGGRAETDWADSELTATYRTAAPALVAEVRRLTQERDEAEQAEAQAAAEAEALREAIEEHLPAYAADAETDRDVCGPAERVERAGEEIGALTRERDAAQADAADATRRAGLYADRAVKAEADAAALRGRLAALEEFRNDMEQADCIPPEAPAHYPMHRLSAVSRCARALRAAAQEPAPARVPDQPPPAQERPGLPAVWDLVIADVERAPWWAQAKARPKAEDPDPLFSAVEMIYATAAGVAIELAVEMGREDILADMRERDRLGRARYGTPLQPFNGRQPLVDAYQEALDLLVYLRQAIYEAAEPSKP